MKYIYIVLTRTNTLLSRAIARFGHMEYSHASLSLSPTLTPMYSFGRVYPHFPFWGAFVEEYINQGVYAMFDTVESSVLEIPVTNRQYKSIKKEIEEFREMHTKYNLLGVVGAKIGIPIERETAFFCSQFVSILLQKGGLISPDVVTALITPMDLTHVDKAVEIYKGPISEYVWEKGEQ